MESIKDNNRIFSKSFQNLLLCALGAIINDETIPKLKCKIVDCVGWGQTKLSY